MENARLRIKKTLPISPHRSDSRRTNEMPTIIGLEESKFQLISGWVDKAFAT